MVWEVREVRYWTDYILGTDHRLFWNMSSRESRQNSDHYLFLRCLCVATLREHPKYLERNKRRPLRPTTTPKREDGLCAALQRASPKSNARDAQKNTWILAATWRIINKRVSAPEPSVGPGTHL